MNSLQEFLDYTEELVRSDDPIDEPVNVEVSAEVFNEISDHFLTTLIVDDAPFTMHDRFYLRKKGINFLIMKA